MSPRNDKKSTALISQQYGCLKRPGELYDDF